MDGAARTQTLTLNTPIEDNNRVGLGFCIVNDEIGPTDETYFDIDFSFTIPTSDTAKLSFGLKAGGHLLNVDFQRLLSQFEINDPNFENNIYRFIELLSFSFYLCVENYKFSIILHVSISYLFLINNG